jgi:predicted dehydrogenase
VSQALSLAASAEASGQLLMISQSRRYYRTLAAFKAQIAEVGNVGLMTTEFYKAPHFGGFREDMDHVLLVDMAIHAFDVARYLLGQDPVAVYCDEFNPSWSWYRAGAAATAVFEMSDGTRYSFNGSWCSGGLETSWNGNWRVSGSLGSACWDGENSPTIELVTPQEKDVLHGDDTAPEEIAGSLAEFIDALRTGTLPSGEIHFNVLSLAMVEAAVKSAETQQRVTIKEVLSSAYDHALASERNGTVRSALNAWDSPMDALSCDS